MDLGTVKENLGKEAFISPESDLFDFTLFAADTRLVFENCISYNSSGTELAKLAKKFLHQFDREIQRIPVPRESKADADTPDKSRAMDSDADQESSDEGVARSDPARKARSRASRDASDDASSDMSDDGEEEGDSDPLPKLKRKQGNLEQLKARAQGTLDELDMERNVPMTAEERVLLRDQVEAAPWEKVDKVVGILKKYVDAAVADLGKGADPEYVTLELNDVEPHLLRDVEAIVNPCSRRDLEVKKIDKIDSDLKDINRRIRDLKRSGSSSGSRKKKRRR